MKAEIIDRLDQPCSEDHLPETVYGNAGRQRIRGVHQPAGEVEPVAEGSAEATGKGGGYPGRDLFSRAVVGAANQQMRLAWGLALLHHHGGGNLIDENFLLFSEVERPPIGLPDRCRRGVFKKIGSDLFRLPRGSAARVCGGNIGNRGRSGEDFRFIGG